MDAQTAAHLGDELGHVAVLVAQGMGQLLVADGCSCQEGAQHSHPSPQQVGAVHAAERCSDLPHGQGQAIPHAAEQVLPGAQGLKSLLGGGE